MAMLFFFFSVLLVFPLKSAQSSDELCARLLVRKTIARNQFVTTRSLIDYYAFLGNRFRERVLKLSKNDHVLDLGCGQGRAARELSGAPIALSGGYEKNPDLQQLVSRKPEDLPFVTGVTFQGEPSFEKNNFRYLSGQLFEDIPEAELLRNRPKFTVVIDFWGVILYTDRVSEALGLVYRTAADGAEIHIKTGVRPHRLEDYLQRVKAGELVSVSNKTTLWDSFVRSKNGEIQSLPEWLARLPHFKGVQVDGTLILTKRPAVTAAVPELKFVGRGSRSALADNPRLFVEE